MKTLVQYLAVAGAGAVGAVARLSVARLFGSPSFPIGTFIINISGSLFLGWFSTVVGTRLMVSDTTKLAVGVGFVGAYTTFSTFMWESNDLLRSGSELKAIANLLGSLFVGLLAVRAGILLARL
jgi:CrcB protein